MFTVKALCKSFVSGAGHQQVLQSLSFSITENSFTAISGPSGSGKSTLLSILSGLESADSGSVLYKDNNLLTLNETAMAGLRNKDFGFVFQTPFFIPYKDVLDNIALPAQYQITEEIDQSYAGSYTERAMELAEFVGLENQLHKSPSLLSGGEQQRMAFARALMLQPEVIFADEPTASLDQHNSENLLKMLADQVAQGKTVIMVSHEKMALEWADEVLEIRQKGKEIVPL